MADQNFRVKHGLTVGPFTVDANGGNVVTTGNITTAGLYSNQYFYANGTPFTSANLQVSLINPAGGLSNTVSSVTALRFDTDSGFDVTDLGSGEVKIGMNSTFKYWEVDGQTTLEATGLDTIQLIAGNNISLTTNTTSSPKSLTISSTVPVGATGPAGPQGATGPQGETGLGFTVAKSYASVAALNADTSPTGITAGQFAIIETGDVENPENSKLYLWNGSAYSYVNDLSGAAGITGPQGATGPVGATGLQGETGAVGSVGYTGSKGDPGEYAALGYTGSQGATGPIGYTGSQGDTGSIGIQGDPGYAGSQGDIGYTGSQGIPGEYAALGYTGSEGATGPLGYTGSQGIPGEAAAIGYTGSQGEIGATGPTGYSGSQGIPGEYAALGYTGSQGEIGATGPTGYTGSTSEATSVTLSPSFKGALLYLSGIFIISSGWRIIDQFTSVAYDTNGFTGYDGRIYIPAGVSKVKLHASLNDSNAIDNINYLVIAKNGDTSFYFSSAGDQAGTHRDLTRLSAMTAVVPVTQGDYFEVAVYCSGSATLDPGSNNWFSIEVFEGSILDTTSVIRTTGYTGSSGAFAAIGFTGSQGVGFTGSQGIPGEYAALGYTGSQGEVGYTGSLGPLGYHGSTGYTGSQGDVGYAGSQGMLGYIGSQGSVGYTGSKGALSNWTVINTNYVAVSNDRIIADTSGGGFTVTLPATPSAGDYVQISDGYDFSTNYLTVARNGSTIEYFNDDFWLNVDNATFEFLYNGSTWKVTATAGPKGYTGSASTVAGYTGSAGIGYTGSAADTVIGFYGSAGGGAIDGNLYVPGTTVVSGNIIPAANVTYSLGSNDYRFKDLYLAGNTIYLGDTTFSANSVLPFNLSIAPEVLTIQVDATEPGDDVRWFWTWETSTLPYARTQITNSPQISVPLYKQGTYTINNFAANELHGNLTQVHKGYFKWVEGAGTQNLISWAVDNGNVNVSHPNINSGNVTSVQRYTVTVPSTIVVPSLTTHTANYSVSFANVGSYTFSMDAEGDNPTLGPMYRGGTYTFTLDSSLANHPFYLTTDNGTGFVANTYVGEYTTGVTGTRANGQPGFTTLTFVVPMNAPSTLYYQCGVHSSMRGAIRIKDLAVDINVNGNYVVYFQHTHEGHATPIELRPIPSLVNQMCLVYDATVGQFVPQDMATYVENTPSFRNKIQEVAGTATLIAPDGIPVVPTVSIVEDASYLPFVNNKDGDISYTEDTKTLYVWDNGTWNSTKAAGVTGYTGSAGAGYTGSASTAVGYTGSAGVGYTGSAGTGGGSGTQTKTVDYSGTLAVFNGTKRWWINTTYTITKVLAFLITSPTGASLNIRINKNGSSAATLSVTAGTSTAESVVSIAVVKGDYITVDITQIGSTVAGADLSVIFEYS